MYFSPHVRSYKEEAVENMVVIENEKNDFVFPPLHKRLYIPEKEP